MRTYLRCLCQVSSQNVWQLQAFGQVESQQAAGQEAREVPPRQPAPPPAPLQDLREKGLGDTLWVEHVWSMQGKNFEIINIYNYLAMCLIREVKHTVSVKFHILYMQLLGLPMIHVWVNLGQWYQTISCRLITRIYSD